MEVRDQRIHHLEFVPGVYEDSRVHLSGTDGSVILRHGLQGPAGGRSDCNNASAVFLCVIDQPCRGFVDHAVFDMHVMLFDVVDLDGTEGTESDVQRELRDADALVLNLFQQLLCEMKPGCRRSRRSIELCIHGIVVGAILERVGDVGRERHLPELVQNLLEDAIIAEPDIAVAVLDNIHNLAGQKTLSERYFRPDLALFPGADQRLPG